jgi:hypothetical protein
MENKIKVNIYDKIYSIKSITSTKTNTKLFIKCISICYDLFQEYPNIFKELNDNYEAQRKESKRK